MKELLVSLAIISIATYLVTATVSDDSWKDLARQTDFERAIYMQIDANVDVTFDPKIDAKMYFEFEPTVGELVQENQSLAKDVYSRLSKVKR
jgi:hypothetical protein